MLNHLRVLAKLLRWRCHTWLPDYVARAAALRRRYGATRPLTDVIFLVTDHFEPSRREGAVGVRKVADWCRRYETIATRHRDCNGRLPQHTWFYRYDYPNDECLRILSDYVFRGCGEIEFHLHHAHDDNASFAHTLASGLAWFNRTGAMIAAGAEPQRAFAYIAGNWALDNGRGDPAYSGCNEELRLLREAGCYADFTFPAFGVNSQPRKVNSIYYATDTLAPKSYDTGVDLRTGGRPSGDLMIFQGPHYLDWQRGDIEHAAFESFAPYESGRIEAWLAAAVHVLGRPEWVFIKLHTHGMQSHDTVVGENFDRLLTDLERYCDRSALRLHYVTAREAHNIARAAEAGHCGNANDYRDFVIAPPVNRMLRTNRFFHLDTWSECRLRLVWDDAPADFETTVEFASLPLEGLRGRGLRSLDMEWTGNTIDKLVIAADGPYELMTATAATDHGQSR